MLSAFPGTVENDGNRKANCQGRNPVRPEIEGRASDCETVARGRFSPDIRPFLGKSVVTCEAFKNIGSRKLLLIKKDCNENFGSK
jgi:hypothetical protein